MAGRIISLSLFAALLVPATAAAQDAPLCDPATPAAAHLTGVPKRLAFGRVTYASYAPRPNDRISSARITIGDSAPWVVAGPMASSSRVAYYVGLDDPPLHVTLSVVERDPATGATCRRDQTRTVRGFRRFFVRSGCTDVRIRPRRIAECTVDSGFVLHHLTWRGWNHRIARAHGMLDPECSDLGNCPPDRAASVRLSRLRYCARGMVYTRLRVRTAGQPEFVRELGCPPNPRAETV